MEDVAGPNASHSEMHEGLQSVKKVLHQISQGIFLGIPGSYMNEGKQSERQMRYRVVALP